MCDVVPHSNFMLHKKLPKNDMVRLHSTKCDGWEDSSRGEKLPA